MADLSDIVREVEIHRNKIKEQETAAAGQIQRSLQSLADNINVLRESGIVVNLSEPAFDQALTQLGLTPNKNGSTKATKSGGRLTKDEVAKLDALIVSFVSEAKGKTASAKDIVAHASAKGYDRPKVVPRLVKVLKKAKGRGEYTLPKA